jgi:hypothetical protein
MNPVYHIFLRSLFILIVLWYYLSTRHFTTTSKELVAMSSTSAEELVIRFKRPRTAAVALCEAAGVGDVLLVVRILNDEQAFKQVQWYLTHSEPGHINVSWMLENVRRALNDDKNIFERRPTQLGDARLALFKLTRAADMQSLKLAVWVCEPWGSLPRMLRVSMLYLMPASLVS